MRASVAEKLFELCDLSEWRTSAYYHVEKRIVGMVDVLAVDLLIPRDHLRHWLGQVPSLCQTALNTLAFDQLSRIDAVFSTTLLRQFITRLRGQRLPAAAEAGIPQGQLLDACESLSNRLAKVPPSNPSRSPVGAERLSRWLSVHCGVDADIEKLFHDAQTVLRRHAPALRQELGGGGAPPSFEVTPDFLRATLDQIRHTLEPWFAVHPALFEGLEFRPMTLLGISGGPRAGYSSLGYVFGTARPVLYYNPGQYRDPGQCRLDVVHEVFPGHHWERTHTYAAFRGRIGALTYESIPFLEGWAKYCETFYAQSAGDPAVDAAWQAQQATVALTALGAMYMHTTDAPLRVIVEELTALSGLPASAAQSIAIRGYFTPIAAMAPFVGQRTLQLLAGDIGARALHELITSKGPTILWGRKC